MKNNIKWQTPIIFLYGLFATVLVYDFIITDSSTILIPKAQAQESMKKLPDFSKISDVKEKKETFFATLSPIIQAENNHVLQLRQLIKTLQNVPVAKLSEKQKTWLRKVSKNYKLDHEIIDSNTFDELLKRVDYVPPSLALTQAAIESGWGSSRFAKQGNNLFGQWCFSTGCGIVPSSRDSDKGHEVAKFDSVNHSVRSYILNLNTHDSYAELRKKRALLRAKSASFKGVTLAKTLTEYSEEGEHYVEKVTEFIQQNKLQRFTAEFESAMEVVTE